MKKIQIPREKEYKALEALLFYPVSTRFRNRFAQRNVVLPMQGVYRNSILSGDKKLLLIKNSKAGCTSLASLLIEYSTGELVDFNDIHLHRSGVFQGPYDWQEFRDAFDNPATFSFTFVREPLDRLLSCFFDFFVDFKNGNTNEHLAAISQRGFSATKSTAENFDVFVDYVEESILEAPDLCNRHWREQTRNIGVGSVKLDFIGKLENYNADVRQVFESVGAGEFLARSKGKVERLNVSKKAPLEVSSNAARKIRKIYANDYEFFGY